MSKSYFRLDLAASQVATEMKHYNQSSVNVNQLDQMLIHLREEIDKSNLVEDQDEDISTFKLGVIPPKTQERDKMITANDHRNFAALCRGVPLLPRSISKNLQCYYTTQGDPYFLYRPLKVMLIDALIIGLVLSFFIRRWKCIIPTPIWLYPFMTF